MRHEIHKFTGSTDCKEAIEAAELSDAIACALSPGGAVNFFDRSGRLIAKVTSRHKVARLLADQTTSLLHCSVNCVSKPDERRPNGSVNLRLILGSVGEEYTPTTQVHANYPVHVVGVSNYQDAIKSCGEGEPVALLHEIDNPFDDLAVVVRTQFGERIGYIPKDSWLMGGHPSGRQGSCCLNSLAPQMVRPDRRYSACGTD